MITIHKFNEERYVTSKDLHKILDYSPSHYARDVEKWIGTMYLFPNKQEFTLPVKNYDFIQFEDRDYDNPASRSMSLEYWIRLELAKLIALDSQSKFKQKFVQWLLSLESKVENLQLVSRDLVLALLEIAKLCSYIDNQISFYKEHKEIWLEFLERNEYAEFDKWRNRILQINSYKEIESQYHINAIFGKARTKIERLAFLDSLKV